LRRFATSPSNPCAFTDWMRTGKSASRGAEYRTGSGSFGSTFCSRSLASLLKWLASQVLPGEHQHIEHVVHDGRGGGAVILLSLTVAGQVFLEFQWDLLLLETGLLACLHAPLRSPAAEPNPIVRWVLWGLAFKLTFLSGATKLLSGDPAWAGWTAMTYHYWTQPLPTWTSWYAAQLPATVHYWSVPGMLAVELVAPFAIFLPPRFRKTRVIACGLMILLQAGIGATGNYGFFNLLTIVLYLALLDDQALRRPAVAQPDPPRPEPAIWRVMTTVAAVVIACLSVVAFVREIQVTAGTPAQIARAWPGRLIVDSAFALTGGGARLRSGARPRNAGHRARRRRRRPLLRAAGLADHVSRTTRRSCDLHLHGHDGAHGSTGGTPVAPPSGGADRYDRERRALAYR
jgi:lipase maturation factor